MEWLFAVSPRHPLAKVKTPLRQDQIQQHRAVVVADTARGAALRGYGRVGGQAALAVPSMRAKILAQREGLGVGWVPRHRAASLLARGELVEKATETPREPNLLYLAWRGDHEGRALQWWLDQLRQPRMAKALLRGVDAFR